MSNYPSFLSLFLPGQHVSTGDVGKSRPLREGKGKIGRERWEGEDWKGEKGMERLEEREGNGKIGRERREETIGRERGEREDWRENVIEKEIDRLGGREGFQE